ncbi:CcdB family protein [Novosphingobium cyanobacteriorum]|uniref:Toxin CcdB n=1 Tax=Novosphingobium cyanobacteriorum TaxID=3024215 RepID=A0ABT6CNX2_9SPHN|nr:CcdB family protein [Novosphingobium cyanobacteriorum]MDF8334800.1 CcdB family protein [Novosphingobium cyanobacteriorum]
MAKFQVWHSRNGGPLLLECQADLLEHLSTRLVVPLLPLAEAPKPAARLNPVFAIDSAPYVMMTDWAATVETRDLGEPVTSLIDHRYEIGNALDMLVTGF